MKEHIKRIGYALVELSDAIVDLFVEPLKAGFPFLLPFGRPDNRVFWKRVNKPLGYYLGHLVGVPAMLVFFMVLGYLSGFVFTIALAIFGVDVTF